MKKNYIYLFFAFVCMACQPKTNIVVNNPIMPIHYSTTPSHIMLTDYLPALTGEEQLTMETDFDYSVTNYTCMEFDLIGDNTLSTLRVMVDSTQLHDIVILPNMPTIPGMISLKANEESVVIGFTTKIEEPITLIALLNDKQVAQEKIVYNAEEQTYTIPTEGKGRDFLRVYASTPSYLFNDILIPLHDGKAITNVKSLTRHDDQAQVLYSLMIDRFHNGNKSNDWKMHNPEVLDIVDYQGGDIAGITKKIKDGFFQELGINTIWISPITQNPWDAWGYYTFKNGNKYDPNARFTRFSGYHGYWPIFATAIDKRFGTDSELKELLATAHKHNINVILDYVANHMHIDSPTLKEHPNWHTDSILPNGKRNFELWDEARLTTWFDVHIPTLDLERNDVCEPMTDSALHWLTNYDFDGYRHDACKHIPENYWRMLTHKMKQRFPNRHIWMIGETYGSPELINTYVKTGMLNAQFDFNVYFTATRAIIGDGDFVNVDRVIRESCATYGAHHTMGNISGNHDQVRFASVAGGGISLDEDGKEAGWTRTIGIVAESDLNNIEKIEQAYKRALLLEVLNLTIPGVPCIYQGDEYAEVGGNDPDNRHMMRFDDLSVQEQQFREEVKKLIKIRRESMPLLYGEYIPVEVSKDKLIFDRTYLGETIRITIDREQLTYSIEHHQQM